MRSVFILALVFLLAQQNVLFASGFSLLTGPVAQDDDNFTYQDFSVTGTLADNDYDPDGDPLTYSLVTGTPDGTITIYPDGSYLYEPNPLAYGIENITYQVCDDDGNCAQAVLTMYVIFLNDDPIAVDDLVTAETNSPFNGNAGLNDIEPDNEIRHYNLITPPTNGTLTFNSNGTFTYTSFVGYTGSDSFEYEICDPCLRCDPGWVTITVVGNNASPIVTDSPLWTLNEEGSYSGSIAGLVSDPESDPISFSITADPEHGSVTLLPDGSFTYTPAPNFFGSDLFEFQACDIVSQCDFGLVYLEVTGQNDPPAVAGETLNMNEDATLNGNVASNDQDDETSQLIYSITDDVDYGDITLNPNGTFSYSPLPNYNGSDVLIYQACDGGGLCQTATLTIQIAPVNDPPVVSNAYFSGPEDNDITGYAGPASDPENNTLTYNLISGPVHGSLFLESDGYILYSPNQNWYGVEDLEYEVCDNQGGCTQAILTIEIMPVNDAPVAADDLTDFAFEGQTINGNLLNNDSDADNDLLTYSTSDVAQNGTFILDEYGTYTYTPDALWHGVETFTITVCDSQNACDQSILSFEIVSVNDGIQAQNGSGSMSEDAVFNGTLVGLATDLDNDPITFSVLSDPANGSLNLLPNGTFVYTPTANFFGTVQFTFNACDPFSSCDDATYTITVNPLNDSPVANEDEFAGNEDTAITGNVGTNDSDIDSGSLTYSLISQPMYGSATLAPNGALVYQPEANFYGIDFITYEVCDGSLCDATTVNLFVIALNDLPVAGDDSYNVLSNSVLNGNLALNDYDVESAQMFYSVFSDVSHGTLTLNTSGTFTYQSETDYSGLDAATIRVCDDDAYCVTTALEIGVLANQSAPEANEDFFSMSEDGLLSASVATNDSDANGGTLSFTLLSEIDHGDLTFDNAGNFVLDTDPNYFGSITFTYEVCDETDLCSITTCTVTVNPVNDQPVATDDYAFFISDGVLTGSVALNDFDVDNDQLTYTLLSPPQYGDMEFLSDGSFVFTSMSVFDGIVVALYQVCDGTSCSTASFVIEISFLNTIPIINEDAFSTNEDTQVSANVGVNDFEPNGENLLFYLTGQPSHGTASIGLNTGILNYLPDPGFSGLDTMIYYACDPCGACVSARIIIETMPVNDAPITTPGEVYVYDDMVLESDLNPFVSDTDGTELTYLILTPPATGLLELASDGTFTYTTDPDFIGTEEFAYKVCDQEFCTNGVVSVEVMFLNDPPVAENDSFETMEDVAISGNVGLNDTDTDVVITEPVFTLIDVSSNGEFILAPDGTFNYLPSAGFSGVETIHYQICDNLNTCDTAEVTITVLFINDLPVVEDEYIILTDNNMTEGDVSANDSDEEGFDLTYSVITSPLHGSFVLESNGTYVYTPFGDFTGEDFIVYEACDDENCVQGALTFLLIGNNNPPAVEDESYNVLEDDDVSGDVSINDSEPDGDPLTYTLIDGPFHGTLEMNTDGSFTYVPELNFYGVDFAVYTACDPFTACVEGTMQLVVDFVNDIPIAEDDFVTTVENTIVEGTVATNDIEYDDEILTYGVLEDQSNGVFEMNPDGSYSYLPNDGAIGTFYVYYQACDPCGACNDAMLTITVEPFINENTSPSVETANVQLCLASSTSIDMNDYVSDLEDTDSNLSFNFNAPSLGLYEFNPNTHVLTYSTDQVLSDDVEITYTVCDNGNPQMCSSGSIVIDVVPVNEIYISNVYVENISCFGETDGSIEIIEIAGVGPFTIDWDNGSTGLVQNNLSAGDYPLTISSEAPCSTPAYTMLSVTGPFAPLSASVVGSNNITEDQSGSINIAVSGGTPPYFVEWFGPGNYNVEAEDADNIGAAGLYTALISDLNGCDTQIDVNITPVIELSDSFDVMISPNPSSGVYSLTLSGTNGREVMIKVYDTAGRMILDQNLGGYASGRTTTVDLTSFAQGIYELQIMAAGSTQMIRLMKNQ